MSHDFLEMKHIKVIFSVIVAWLLLGIVSCGGRADGVESIVDSLNTQSYMLRYSSLTESAKFADEVLESYADCGYDDGVNEALINKSFIYFMQMRYDSAQICCKQVLHQSDNDLICCMADISLMAICNKIAQSKEFYDYRNDAQERIDKIADEIQGLNLTEHQQQLWNRVQMQFRLISISYYVAMRQQAVIQENIEWMDNHIEYASEDSTLFASYLIHKALNSIKDGVGDDAINTQRRNLVRLLSVSTMYGYSFLKAEGMVMLSKSIMRKGDLKPSQKVYVEELVGATDDDNIGKLLAERAADLFRDYGNKNGESKAYIMLSDYYLAEGDYSKALELLDHALQLVNIHHREVNISHEHIGESVADVLYTYSPVEDSLSTEMRWIADPNIITSPAWMAEIREQLSVVYGAMGMKAESDYNHNIYFDILDATRQDQRVQQQEDILNREERWLNFLIAVFAVAIVLLAWGLYMYNARSKRIYRKRMRMLSSVIDVCKKMNSALNDDLEDEEELIENLHQLTDNDVKRIFPYLNAEDWTKADVEKMNGLDRELYNVLLVFFNWMKNKGLQLVKYAENAQQLESETYLLEKKYEENKRQYLEKLTSMSIVNGITPFIDRAMHEMQKLNADKAVPFEEKKKEEMMNRFKYVSELIVKINEYNDVLGHWVKIRRGMVNLNIENFALQPLLDTLRRGGKTFENKNITLNINDSDSVVRADKSLTLFMMNTLLDNARKYTPEGGTITLSTNETDSYVEISVQDSGVGMSEEDVDVLNNSKVYDSSKIGSVGENAEAVKSQKGFGFGLMNCKGIIGKYLKTNAIFSVCKFGVESSLGEGSRFYFRLPKGVIKALMLLFICLPVRMMAENTQKAYEYSDSLFSCNVKGEYERALLFADSAIQVLNRSYLADHPDATQLMKLSGTDMPEVEWMKDGVVADFNLIISIRNEVAISALALNENGLYHYNSELLTRLYKMSSLDENLEEYCVSIRQANRDKKAILIMLGLVVVLVVVIYFFLYYRHNQLFIFNLRQFIQLNHKVFSASQDEVLPLVLEGLADIKMVDTVALAIADMNSMNVAGDKTDVESYKLMMDSCFNSRQEVKSINGDFHAYPLSINKNENNVMVGVLGVKYHNGKLTDEEKLIIDLVCQFIAIHTYFTRTKIEERNVSLELLEDERRRVENEQQKVYVQNMIMDNCMSALKHETMYYPNRIKQIVDSVLESKTAVDTESDKSVNEIDTNSILCDSKIEDMYELMNYYKEIFTILSTCAGKQVERVLFKRTSMSVSQIGEMVCKSFKKSVKKTSGRNSASRLIVEKSETLSASVDKIFLQSLIDNVISLFFEHDSGGNMHLQFESIDGFVKCSFTDTEYRFDESEIPNLFYVDNVKYDSVNDSLVGMQYLLAKQIIREHDQYSNRRGCRIYVENETEGNGSRFVFTLPVGREKT